MPCVCGHYSYIHNSLLQQVANKCPVFKYLLFFLVFFLQKTAASFWESETGFNSYDVSSDHVTCFYHDPRTLCCPSTQTWKRLVCGGTVSDII